MPKIGIIFDFQESAYGGANQFLKALRSEFKRIGVFCLSEDCQSADAVIFNANPSTLRKQFFYILKILITKPTVKIILRFAGPLSLMRQNGYLFDKFFYHLAQNFADGIICQSDWSFNQNIKNGLSINIPAKVIINAADPEIFLKKQKTNFDPEKKIKLIAVSWSDNPSKGFEDYLYLDQNLDWKRFEMIFVGNSQQKFSNITNIAPVSSEELSKILADQDIFIFASRIEPCSNALIEALQVGLPSLVYGASANPELIGQSGLSYTTKPQMLAALSYLVENYHKFYPANAPLSIQQAATNYTNFIAEVPKRSPRFRLAKCLALLFHYMVLVVRSSVRLH